MDLHRFFYPASIAVIGVSLSKLSLGNIVILRNLTKGYKGKLYGVGSCGGVYNGVPVYASVDALPEVPDVAIILTPSTTVPRFLEDCGKKGIIRVVIESGGFSEFSSGHENLEEEILSIAERYQMQIIGPNCLGIFNIETNMVMPFGLSDMEYKPGPVSIVSRRFLSVE